MRSRFRFLACVCLGSVSIPCVLLGRGLAQESPESPLFRWEAPPECPPRADVLARVARNLGRTVPLRGSGVIEKKGRFALTLKLRVNDRDTERELEADQCESLADAAALLAAMAVDPAETMRRRAEGADAGAPSFPPTEVADAGPDVAAAAPEPLRARTMDDAGTPETPPALSGFLRAGASMDTSTTPSVVPGAGLQGGLAIAWFRASLGLSAFAASEARSAKTTSVGASLSLRSATLDGCFVPFAWRPIEPALCASASIDWVHAAAFGAFQSLTEDVLWVTLGLSLETRAYMTRGVFLGLQAGGFVPLRQRTFTIAGEGTLFSPASVSFRGSIGPGVTF